MSYRIKESAHIEISGMIANKIPMRKIASHLGVSISTLYRYMRKYMTDYVCKKRMEKNKKLNSNRGLIYLADGDKAGIIPTPICHTKSPCVQLDKISDNRILFSTPVFDLSLWKTEADAAVTELGQFGRYLHTTNLTAILLNAVTDINIAARHAATICRQEGIVVEE